MRIWKLFAHEDRTAILSDGSPVAAGEITFYAHSGRVGAKLNGKMIDLADVDCVVRYREAAAPAQGPPARVEAMLEQARSMLGLHERYDTARLQVITGRSGINPATTPWCAAWAMNLLEIHRVLSLEALENRNYCPTIRAWAKGRDILRPGSHRPRPGDAILFTWSSEPAQPDHVGLVERVEGTTIYTLEGNSDDQVQRRAYAVGAGVIAGYVSDLERP